MTLGLSARTLARNSFEAAFEAPAFVRAMLDFEAALAEAEAAEGIIPAESANAIRKACASIEIDVEALVAEGKRSATLVVPLVKMLAAEVSRLSSSAAQHLHYGATSQDVLDTATALCLKPCLAETDHVLEATVRALVRRAREHQATPMLGRTLMQPALPITAGLKIARWALALAQDRERLSNARKSALALQLGGPVGTLGALGANAGAVRKQVAATLALADTLAWHVHRGDWLTLLESTGHVVLTTGKIARDVALLSQPEVGEMLEATPRAGAGASSSMPHKRNPAGCAQALAAATRMPGLLSTLYVASIAEHERALGGWQAELAIVPDIAGVLGMSLDFLETIASSLVINADRMRANLEAYGDVDADLGALGPALGEIFERLGDYS